MTFNLTKSRELMETARGVMPGGVNSPVRAYGSIGGTPPFIERASGCRVIDADGNSYIDLVLSYGPLILGHGHPGVMEALAAAASRGITFGGPTEAEIRLAEKIISMVPSVEMVRLVNSGTEATMSALRLARAWTGRSSFIKFNGCYHGHGDSFLVKAGSGALTQGTPDSPGVVPELAACTLVAEYNDLESTQKLFASHGKDIAAIFVEPVAGNMGCVLPEPGFLEGLRSLCDQHGALLIFDEVMTGFRVAPGGYQEICGITPDLTTLGKIIGGGLPVGAYGGRREIMERIAPAGDVYQAGTLSGNPLAVAAGQAMLDALSDPAVYDQLEDTAAGLEAGLRNILDDLKIPGCINRQGAMLCLYFNDGPVRSLQDATASDSDRFPTWHARMLEAGVILPPSPYEALFLSTAHTTEDIDHILEAARNALTGQ